MSGIRSRLAGVAHALFCLLSLAAGVVGCASGGGEGGGGSAPARVLSCLLDRACKNYVDVAHRGSNFFAPENTIAAFRLGIEQGADVVESDVRRSLDGFLVMMHDSTVDRTTNGAGEVDEMTFEEISALQVLPPDERGYIDEAYVFLRAMGLEPTVTEPQPIPTLGQTLDFLRGRALLDLDMNVEDADVGQVAQEVVESGGLRDVLFLVESVEKAERVREVAPEAILIARPGDLDEAQAFYARFPADDLPIIHINPDDSDFSAVAALADERGSKLFVNTLGTWDVVASLAEAAARNGGADPYQSAAAARTVYEEFFERTPLDIVQTDRMDIVGPFVDDLNLLGGSAFHGRGSLGPRGGVSALPWPPPFAMFSVPSPAAPAGGRR